MTFEESLDQAIAMLQRRGRVSYRTLTLQFHLDKESLETLKEELIEIHHLAVDHDGRMLVWTGEARTTSVSPSPQPSHQVIQQKTNLLRWRPQPRRAPQTPNGASSPCCSVTWSTRRRSPASLTRKTFARWCTLIKRPAPR